MDTTQIHHMLTRNIRRGLIIFSILKLISIIFCGFALVTDGLRPWAAVSFMASIIFLLGFIHVQKRGIAAWKVSQDPQIVYWAHPSTAHEPLSSNSILECRILTLHLRDATQLEVNLPLEQMHSFIAWLKEHNSTIRWGSYDQNNVAVEL